MSVPYIAASFCRGLPGALGGPLEGHSIAFAYKKNPVDDDTGNCK